ncbi:MAG: carbohydrate-binding family 9-like protein [Clostridia bacterium]|nr:carbohydrate-binding family 9-like protein [Clostridia bacterium]
MIAYLKDNITGEQTPFTTILNYSRVGNELHFNFVCENSKLFSAYSGYNEPIYRGDVCEVFLCTGGNLKEYYEIEVAPNGAVFFAKIFNEGDLHVTFLDQTITARVEITDIGYNVEIVIPCDAIGVKQDTPILFNAFRIETEGGEENRNLLALNPTLVPRFHVPEKFIELE